jgi:hypothetical protein
MRFSELIGPWAESGQRPINSNNPPQSLIGTSCHICSKTLFIYRCLVETVKLNFHLETYATLDHNLDSGLCLELQVCCELVSHKPLTDTGLPQGFPAGGAYASELMRHTPRPFMSLLKSTQLSRTATFNSQTHIGVFLKRCSAGQHLRL